MGCKGSEVQILSPRFFLKLIALVSFSFSSFAECSLEMSLEEKAGQLLMVHFNGETVNDDAKTLIQKVHVGGFIYYNWANGLNSPEQVSALSRELQKLSTIPLFIAIDQEGGRVARLTKGFTIFPGNKALGMTGDPELAEQCAFAMGQELHAVGVNFNLAPVVDVNSNPQNPVIGTRSFGDSPEIVIAFAQKAIQGYHRAKIITAIKHFPGHGDVSIDSHQDLPLVQKTQSQLQRLEFLPFSKLAAETDTIMTAHILVPSIDPDNCATLSKNVLDILRKDFGFKGIIVSDSLVMKGLLKNCASIDEAAIRAINAGCDILILGGKQLMGTEGDLELTVKDVERIHRSLIQAVKIGQISTSRIDDAVQRILKLKSQYQISVVDENEEKSINTKEHQNLAKKIGSF